MFKDKSAINYVFQLVKSDIWDKDKHPKNIKLIIVTWEVSKEDKFNYDGQFKSILCI